MQFNAIPYFDKTTKSKQATQRPPEPVLEQERPQFLGSTGRTNPLGFETDVPAVNQPVGSQQAAAVSTQTHAKSTATVITENLLSQIPGEATGFYILAMNLIKNPKPGDPGTLRDSGIVFGCALILLVVARFVAKASRGIMISSIIAFLLWMLIYDKGFLHFAMPNLLPDPLGLILAAFYTALVTLLASAGIIK